jgi:hypothetical protein
MRLKEYKENIKFLLGGYFFPMPADQRFYVNKLIGNDLIEYVNQFVTEKTYCVHLHTTSWQ